jgi:hypothetical protein
MMFRFAVMILAGLMSLSDGIPQENNANYNKLFQTSSKDFKTPANARELKTVRSFPNSEISPDAIYIGGGESFYEDKAGKIYIPDFKNDEVLVFNAQGSLVSRFGRFGQGPGEFQMPRDIYISENRILIREAMNLRFQWFDMAGKYIGGFKAFKPYHSFVFGEGKIYAAAGLSQPPISGRDSCLIDIMDYEGRVLRSFGKPLGVPIHSYLILNSTRITYDRDGNIIVAFRFYPLIRKYDIKGDLLAEYSIKSGISDKIAPINFDMIEKRAKGERTPLGFVINAIFANDDGIYVASAATGRLEILLLGSMGEVIEYYYKDLNEPIGINSLLVKTQGQNKEFYLLRLYPEHGVEVLSPRNQKEEK